MLCHGTNSKNISTSNKTTLAGWLGRAAEVYCRRYREKLLGPKSITLRCTWNVSSSAPGTTVSQPPLLNCQTYVSRQGLVREGPGDTSAPPHTAVIKKAWPWIQSAAALERWPGPQETPGDRWWSTDSQGLLVLNCHRPVSCLCHRVSWWQDRVRALGVPSGAKKVSFFVQEWAGVLGSGVLWNLCVVLFGMTGCTPAGQSTLCPAP